ncbi:hypothetical protein [Candidatus Poriferisodalis sp.]|uniref:hypothetical protein n=1 Tax=Candidatus Poriferisodalis sp. TaxID=3101277 RepID=UPI003B5BAC23
MTFGMLDDPSEMEGYASAVARVAGIPQQHVEKDFWITEALRGVANAAAILRGTTTTSMCSCAAGQC